MASSTHIAILGAGSVGGYVGGHLARAGHDVTLIDAWPEHVERMKSHGLHIRDARGEHLVQVTALHVNEAQSLVRKPVDVAMICSNSYDTEWLAVLVKPYLSPAGHAVSIQNGMNEDCIAGVLGAHRTLGCIASTISVNCYEPGRISRFKAAVADGHTVFRVGELDGAVTARVQRLAELLRDVDTAEVTRDLRSERWTKLVANTITHGLLGATGLTNEEVLVGRGAMHFIGVKLAAEAIAVGRAQGLRMGSVLGIEADDWHDAGNGDVAALRRVQDGLVRWTAGFTEFSRSSVGRDVAKGRRSEVDFTNGLVAERGRALGVPAPTHAALTQLMRRIDRRELAPDPANIAPLARAVEGLRSLADHADAR
jgi:2-dehydropantoate 2-reductase